MLDIVIILLPLFGLVGFGYIVGRSSVADRSWITVLNLFGYYLAFPGLILKSLLGSNLSLTVHGSMILVQVIFGVIVLLATWGICTVLRVEKKLRNTLTIGVYFSNAGYIGIPALQLVFGDAAAAEGTVIVSVMIALTLTLGVSLLESSRSRHLRLTPMLKNFWHNPLIWAIAIGSAVGLAGWHLPRPLPDMINLLAASAAPTVLVSLGIFLARNRVKRATLQTAALLTGIKMIVIPTALALVLWVVPNSEWLHTTFIQGCMPIAVTAFALAQLYPMNKELISTSIVMSTVVSFVTIPLAMWVAQTVL